MLMIITNLIQINDDENNFYTTKHDHDADNYFLLRQTFMTS